MEASSGVSRWPALSTAAAIFRVLAWVILIVGGIAVLVGAIDQAFSLGGVDDGSIISGIVFLFIGWILTMIYAVFTFAFAELLNLAVSVESGINRMASK
jgi:hypothetical protein